MENWTDVTWYEWIYKISDKWNMISCERVKTFKRIYKWKEYIQSQTIPEKEIKFYTNVDGYKCMKLSKDWKQVEWRRNRIVYCSFNNLPLQFTKDNLICHKNDIRDDDRLENLYLWTSHDNNQDIYDRWRNQDRKWSKHPLAKLTEEKVKEIKQKIAIWERIFRIAKEYWVEDTAILAIRDWRTWKHI